MRRIIPILIAALLGCSSDNDPPPVGPGMCNPVIECCPFEQGCEPTGGEEGEAEGSPAGEGEGEGGSTAITGGETLATTTGESADDTTTSEPPVTTTGETDTTTDAPDMGVSSSSTGDECPEWGRYQCRGWVAGIYCREDDLDCNGNPGFGPEFLINGEEYYTCVDNIEICVPYVGEDDSAFLFDECRAACNDIDWMWPAEIDTGLNVWYLQESRCVFNTDGNQGYLNYNGVLAGQAQCDWINQNPDETQVLYQRPCDNAECQDTSECEDWAGWVDTKVEMEIDERSNTIYTTVASSLWDEVQDHGGYAHIYACEEGRYHEHLIGGLSSWKIKDPLEGELFYELGFRDGDSYVKIAWLGTATVWTYLDSYEDMAAFYDAHHDKVAFKLEWLRGLDVYTMYLSKE